MTIFTAIKTSSMFNGGVVGFMGNHYIVIFQSIYFKATTYPEPSIKITLKYTQSNKLGWYSFSGNTEESEIKDVTFSCIEK